jgi:hypothetical protein
MSSAVHPITDITKLERHVRKVPIAEVTDFGRTFQQMMAKAELTGRAAASEITLIANL